MPTDFVIPLALLGVGYVGSGIIWLVRKVGDYDRRLAVIEDRLKIKPREERA
ncbi:MAG TPA: hypothetical protein VFA22_07160 [Stellaceae bacterium]|nr:hypothetical protein [Stellaceae bacterium]